MLGTKILVCGGQDFANPGKHRRGTPGWDKADLQRVFIFETLFEITKGMDEYCIIAGGAPGADTAAVACAMVHWVEFKEYPADWKKYGPSAGPIRNQQMIDEGKPDLVVAFPGGHGTADMVARAKKAGIPVKEISYPN